jgi:hypothetical protein
MGDDFIYNNLAAESSLTCLGFIFLGRHLYSLSDIYSNPEAVASPTTSVGYGGYDVDSSKCSAPHHRRRRG